MSKDDVKATLVSAGSTHSVCRWPLAAGRWPLAAGRWPLATAAGRCPRAAVNSPVSASLTTTSPHPMTDGPEETPMRPAAPAPVPELNDDGEARLACVSRQPHPSAPRPGNSETGLPPDGRNAATPEKHEVPLPTGTCRTFGTPLRRVAALALMSATAPAVEGPTADGAVAEAGVRWFPAGTLCPQGRSRVGHSCTQGRLSCTDPVRQESVCLSRNGHCRRDPTVAPWTTRRTILDHAAGQPMLLAPSRDSRMMSAWPAC